MTPEQTLFLQKAAAEGRKAGHIFPEMAACEAALESAYGRSGLASDNNLFGMKVHRHMIYGTHVLPTHEFENGEWITINSSWIVYPSWAACFADRIATLTRLAPYFVHYRNALAAKDASTYIVEVSQTWSTDPARGAKVQAIYDAMAGEWSAPWPQSVT